MNLVCKKHPAYEAKRRARCPSCQLLFILRWQWTKEAEYRLGGINPYQFLNLPIEQCCEEIKYK